MDTLGLQSALGKCQAPDTTLSWIGCHFDSFRMIMRIDRDKLAEAILWCDAFLQAQTVTYKYMQRFLGKLFYAIRCAEPAKRFTMRLLDLLKAAQAVNHSTISHEARLDVLWQRAFLPLYNGENIMKPSVAERCCFVDACLSSAGGYSREHGFCKFVYPQHMQELQFCISALEAFNLLVAVRLWAPEWAGKNVIIYTDNWVSVCAINSGSAREPLLRSISRELWWQCAVHDIKLTVRHRPGAMMEAADTFFFGKRFIITRYN